MCPWRIQVTAFRMRKAAIAWENRNELHVSVSDFFLDIFAYLLPTKVREIFAYVLTHCKLPLGIYQQTENRKMY